MISGLIKYYRFPMEEVLYGMSYTNIVLLSSAIPSYGDGDGAKDAKKEDSLRADDPANADKILRMFGQ